MRYVIPIVLIVVSICIFKDIKTSLAKTPTRKYFYSGYFLCEARSHNSYDLYRCHTKDGRKTSVIYNATNITVVEEE